MLPVREQWAVTGVPTQHLVLAGHEQEPTGHQQDARKPLMSSLKPLVS